MSTVVQIRSHLPMWEFQSISVFKAYFSTLCSFCDVETFGANWQTTWLACTFVDRETRASLTFPMESRTGRPFPRRSLFLFFRPFLRRSKSTVTLHCCIDALRLLHGSALLFPSLTKASIHMMIRRKPSFRFSSIFTACLSNWIRLFIRTVLSWTNSICIWINLRVFSTILVSIYINKAIRLQIWVWMSINVLKLKKIVRLTIALCYILRNLEECTRFFVN